jgi:hypothetical protein
VVSRLSSEVEGFRIGQDVVELTPCRLVSWVTRGGRVLSLVPIAVVRIVRSTGLVTCTAPPLDDQIGTMKDGESTGRGFGAML